MEHKRSLDEIIHGAQIPQNKEKTLIEICEELEPIFMENSMNNGQAAKKVEKYFPEADFMKHGLHVWINWYDSNQLKPEFKMILDLKESHSKYNSIFDWRIMRHDENIISVKRKKVEGYGYKVSKLVPCEKYADYTISQIAESFEKEIISNIEKYEKAAERILKLHDVLSLEDLHRLKDDIYTLNNVNMFPKDIFDISFLQEVQGHSEGVKTNDKSKETNAQER